MKKLFVLILCICLLSAFACGKQDDGVSEGTDAPQTELTPDAQGGGLVGGENILRVESIDYDAEKEQIILNCTQLNYGPVADGGEPVLTDGNAAAFLLGKEAIIEFPILEDPTQTVAITAGEFSEEFLAYMEQFPDQRLMFSYEFDGTDVTKMVHFTID